MVLRDLAAWGLRQEHCAAIHRRAAEQLASFPGSVKRFVNPHEYFVGPQRGLHER